MNEAARISKSVDNRLRTVKMCQGKDPAPQGRGDIEFLIRKAQTTKTSGEALTRRRDELDAALREIQKEILRAQGAIDTLVDAIAELLEEADENKSDKPPQEPLEAPTLAAKSLP